MTAQRVVLLSIYTKGLGFECKLDFRESAFFCTFTETEHTLDFKDLVGKGMSNNLF